MKVPFQPRTIPIPANNPYEEDLLNRKPIADALTNLIVSIDDTAVIAVDGAWGSGKTTFLQMWAQQLRNRGCPVITFNAWETDSSDDPLIALTSELMLGLRDCNPDLQLEGLKEKAANLISKLFASSFLRLLKLASAGLVDLSQEQLKELTQADVESPSDRLVLYEESKKTISEFKCSLSQTVDILLNKESKLPLVILIDELDRCRPIYAIELLEHAKHLFSVPNVIFVLGVNTAQLACSVSALYGSRFNSVNYLKRFFNLDMSLPEAGRSQLIESTLHSLGMDSKFMLTPHFTGESLQASMLGMVSNFFDLIELDYRSLDQALRRMALVYHSSDSEKEWQRVFYIVMFIFRTIDYPLYRQFFNLEVNEESVVYGIFSRNGGEKLIQSDVGSLFAIVIVAIYWDLQGRPRDIEHFSSLFSRINSRIGNENLYPSTDLEKKKQEELFDRMNPVRSSNTLGILLPLINQEQDSFQSVFELIELFNTTQAEVDKRSN